ncbi:MAG: HD domain-containing protein [Caldilineaceae bacterium SB0661_bin_32]|uniref:HD domain-containing protein n=1 Tax=Caldilineaceae bacterium SB0661_bin_32 TaxID=2605255 RepID=A0A6B1D773_9CHLR|nr:HD domain-containing protein [Caldilineaceae bacterium SB0661_bin_32]
MTNERLARQLQFILEIDKLKEVLRRSLLLDSRRRENSAEHSWHLAVMALVLAEHANEPIDPLHTLKLVLVHDIVEIDAGDTYAYDPDGHAGKVERERRAAQRIFGLLPADQAKELSGLWEEYEGQQTPESRFALALDRLMPLLHNYHSGGVTWRENRVTVEQVVERMKPVAISSDALGQAASAVIDQAMTSGLLPDTWSEP